MHLYDGMVSRHVQSVITILPRQSLAGLVHLNTVSVKQELITVSAHFVADPCDCPLASFTKCRSCLTRDKTLTSCYQPHGSGYGGIEQGSRLALQLLVAHIW